MKKALFIMVIFGLAFSGMSFAENVIKDGVQKTYYPNGKIETETPFKNGKQDGTELRYTKDGKLLTEGYWKEGTLLGHKKFYPNGNISQEVVRSKDGQFPESTKSYYESGQLQLEGKKSGAQHVIRWYYPNGQRQADIIYQERESGQDDIAEKDPRAGQIMSYPESSDWDIVNQTLYDEQGNVLENGILQIYSEKGEVTAEMPLKDGKPNGIGKLYGDDGKLFGEMVYENGKEISRKVYEEKGNLIEIK